MYTTCADIFKLKIADNFTLRAGNGGLYRKIDWFYICQDNAVKPWCRGKELVILYGAGMQLDDDSLVLLIEECAQNNIAGIIIVMGRFFESISEKMIVAANHYQIPLIESVESLPIGDITKGVTDLISRNKDKSNQGDSVLKDLIYGNIEDIWKGKAIGKMECELKRHNFIITIQVFGILDLKEHYAGRFLIQRMFDYIQSPIYFASNNKIIVLVNLDDDLPLDIIKNRCEQFLANIGTNKEYQQILIGVGSDGSELNGIRKSYQDSLQAIESIAIYNREDESNNKSKEEIHYINQIILYQNIPILHKLLSEIDSKELLRSCFTTILQPLISYDNEHGAELLKSMSCYLEENCNIVKASERLYIHRNTMNYRMNKIKEIANCDFESAENRFELMCALKIYQYCSMQKAQRFTDNLVHDT